MRARLLAAFSLAALRSVTAVADGAEAQQCTSIQDDAQRLACFDRATARAAALPPHSAEQAKALNAWSDAIRRKIHENMTLPRAIEGNPSVVFRVTLRPTGEVLSVKLQRSSGQKDFDAAVQRAILKASPLPVPQSGAVFTPVLEIRHYANGR
jgi:colicin import membrane protein